MRILIAEDEPVSQLVLQRTLTNWGHEVVVTCDGLAAWQLLEQENSPKLALLDWMMPALDGPEICRRVRLLSRPEPTYLILLTAKHHKEEVVAGLESGANDYLVKPFDPRELRSRIQVGERMLALQHDLAERVRELEQALVEVTQLQGLLPICSYCKKIRDDQNYWQSIESYFLAHTNMKFSHGVCAECFEVAMEQIEKAGHPCLTN
jgi:phosphoserine phosphatase RsbU/P